MHPRPQKRCVFGNSIKQKLLCYKYSIQRNKWLFCASEEATSHPDGAYHKDTNRIYTDTKSTGCVQFTNDCSHFQSLPPMPREKVWPFMAVLKGGNVLVGSVCV
jgi:hypothetical protein